MHIATEADCTIASLASAHEASERTIRRDLAALEFAGFHVDSVWVDGHKCWRLTRPLVVAINTWAGHAPAGRLRCARSACAPRRLKARP
mgnify:CR=1 FL=1